MDPQGGLSDDDADMLSPLHAKVLDYLGDEGSTHLAPQEPSSIDLRAPFGDSLSVSGTRDLAIYLAQCASDGRGRATAAAGDASSTAWELRTMKRPTTRPEAQPRAAATLADEGAPLQSSLSQLAGAATPELGSMAASSTHASEGLAAMRASLSTGRLRQSAAAAGAAAGEAAAAARIAGLIGAGGSDTLRSGLVATPLAEETPSAEPVEMKTMRRLGLGAAPSGQRACGEPSQSQEWSDAMEATMASPPADWRGTSTSTLRNCLVGTWTAVDEQPLDRVELKTWRPRLFEDHDAAPESVAEPLVALPEAPRQARASTPSRYAQVPDDTVVYSSWVKEGEDWKSQASFEKAASSQADTSAGAPDIDTSGSTEHGFFEEAMERDALEHSAHEAPLEECSTPPLPATPAARLALEPRGVGSASSVVASSAIASSMSSLGSHLQAARCSEDPKGSVATSSTTAASTAATEDDAFAGARRRGGVEVMLDALSGAPHCGMAPRGQPVPRHRESQDRGSQLRAPRARSASVPRRTPAPSTSSGVGAHAGVGEAVPGCHKARVPDRPPRGPQRGEAQHREPQREPQREPPTLPRLAPAGDAEAGAAAVALEAGRPRARAASQGPREAPRRSLSVPAAGRRAGSVAPGSNVQSNRKLVRNAIERYCLKGDANKSQREQILQAFDTDLCGYERFIILFRSVHTGRHDIRALYGYREGGWARVVQALPSPPILEERMVAQCLRYDSGGKEFKEVPATQELLNVADAVFVHPQHLQKSRLVQ